MEVYEVAYLFLGIATIVAAGTIINYSRVRSKASQDPEIRKAFRPLYLFGFGLAIYGLGALLTYFSLADYITLWSAESFITGYNPFINYYYLFYTLTLIELIFLSIAAAMILQQRIIAVFMILLTTISYLLMFNAILNIEEFRVSDVSEFYVSFGSVLMIITIAAVAALFMWIAFQTKRSTSFALGYALTFQVLAVPRLMLDRMLDTIIPSELIIAISMGALIGPAMIAFAFLRPDQKISAELLGYGASFAAPVYIIIALIVSGLIYNLQIALTASSGAIAAALGAAIASYSYGRWRENKQLPTALLFFIFTFFTAGLFIGILGNVVPDIMPYITGTYIDLVASSLALIIFAVVAFLAAGYRTAASIPFFIYIPTIILIVQQYPDPIDQAFLAYWYLGLAVMILFFIPVILFSITWRRMKVAGAPGRSRPLGMAIGLLLYVLIRFPLLLMDFPFMDPGYGLVVSSFIVFWLSITGRLERNQ